MKVHLIFLPSGPIPEQPLELLSSMRFEKILEQLGNHYDRIVIDCPPTQAVSDGLVLAKLSDAVVYVVKSHDTTMDLVKRGTERLRQINAPLAGILMTQVDIAKITAYGGDYYYQGYYDYYGYHDSSDDAERGKGGSRNRGAGKLRLSQEELMDIRTDNSDVELDLDFGNSERLRNRMSTRQIDCDVDEFDSTARLDVVTARTRTNGRVAQRVQDDLDII